jgi:hypothetical protein
VRLIRGRPSAREDVEAGGLAPDCITVRSSHNHSGIALKCRSCWTPRYSPTEKWWGLVCFDHTRFERFDIVRTAFYRAVPTGTLLRLC